MLVCRNRIMRDEVGTGSLPSGGSLPLPPRDPQCGQRSQEETMSGCHPPALFGRQEPAWPGTYLEERPAGFFPVGTSKIKERTGREWQGTNCEINYVVSMGCKLSSSRKMSPSRS